MKAAGLLAVVLSSTPALAQKGLRTYEGSEARVKSNASPEVSKLALAHIDRFCETFQKFFDGLKRSRRSVWARPHGRDAGLPHPAPTETSPAPQTVGSLPVDELPGLSNFAKVDEGLYRGAQPTSAGMEVLKSLGAKTVVNLRSMHSDRDELKGKGFRYALISCKAWHPEEEDVVRFLAIATDPANHPVFVHCQHGADRTGMTVAAYRVVEQSWSAEDAATELPRFGFHPIWTGIGKQVLEFDAEDLRSKIAPAQHETLEIVP